MSPSPTPAPKPAPAARVLEVSARCGGHSYLVRFHAGQGSAAIGAVQRWARSPAVPLTWKDAVRLCGRIAVAQCREFLRLVRERCL